MMNIQAVIEMHTFISDEGEVLQLACEISLYADTKCFNKVILPEGRKACPRVMQGERIYISYKKKKWYLT